MVGLMLLSIVRMNSVSHVGRNQKRTLNSLLESVSLSTLTLSQQLVNPEKRLNQNS